MLLLCAGIASDVMLACVLCFLSDMFGCVSYTLGYVPSSLAMCLQLAVFLALLLWLAVCLTILITVVLEMLGCVSFTCT